MSKFKKSLGEIKPFEVKAVNYNTPEKKEELKKLKKKQQEILEQKNVDWQRLNAFVFKI